MADISLILKEKGSSICQVTPDTPIIECLKKMKALNIGSVLVMDNGKVLGLFSERVAVRNVYVNKLDLESTPVSDVMRTDIPMGRPDMGIKEVMEIFTNERIRQIPILANDEVVGIISIGDVTKWIIEQQQTEIVALFQYISGEK